MCNFVVICFNNAFCRTLGVQERYVKTKEATVEEEMMDLWVAWQECKSRSDRRLRAGNAGTSSRLAWISRLQHWSIRVQEPNRSNTQPSWPHLQHRVQQKTLERQKFNYFVCVCVCVCVCERVRDRLFITSQWHQKVPLPISFLLNVLIRHTLNRFSFRCFWSGAVINNDHHFYHF